MTEAFKITLIGLNHSSYQLANVNYVLVEFHEYLIPFNTPPHHSPASFSTSSKTSSYAGESPGSLLHDTDKWTRLGVVECFTVPPIQIAYRMTTFEPPPPEHFCTFGICIDPHMLSEQTSFRTPSISLFATI